MCICVLRFTLHYINFRWSHKFVYSPLSFHYKFIVIHSIVSHLVRVKEQIKLCKSMGCLCYNFIICDHHMRPPIQYTITLHGDPDQGLQPAEEGGKLIYLRFFSTRNYSFMPQPWSAIRFFRQLWTLVINFGKAGPFSSLLVQMWQFSNINIFDTRGRNDLKQAPLYAWHSHCTLQWLSWLNEHCKFVKLLFLQWRSDWLYQLKGWPIQDGYQQKLLASIFQLLISQQFLHYSSSYLHMYPNLYVYKFLWKD